MTITTILRKEFVIISEVNIFVELNCLAQQQQQQTAYLSIFVLSIYDWDLLRRNYGIMFVVESNWS